MTSKEISMPLSGDVLQTINPWTIWLKSWNQQLGFINITNVESGDYEMEKRIIEEVASYGRQLGWISEVLNLVRNRVDFGVLDKEQSESLEQFDKLIEDVKAIKEKSGSGEITIGKLDLMINNIRALKNKEPEIYDKMVSRIKEAFP